MIDRDPDFFSPILNYLRHGKLILNSGVSEEGILAEADFYNLPMLSQLIMERMQDRENSLKDLVRNVQTCIIDFVERFRQINLCIVCYNAMKKNLHQLWPQ